MSRLLQISEIKERYLAKNLIFKDNEFTGIQYKYTTECMRCGSVWKAYANVILNTPTSCRECTLFDVMCKRFQEWIKSLKNRDIGCLDAIFSGMKTKYNFVCLKCNYVWCSSFKNVNHRKTGCPSCANNVKYSYEYIKNESSKHGLKFISTDYNGIHKKHIFECIACGYLWQTTPHAMLTKKHGCLKCSGSLKLTLNQVEKRLNLNSIDLLDKENYSNTNAKYKFKCLSCSNIWRARLTTVLNNNSGCPSCAGSKNEKITIQTLSEILGIPVNKKYIKSEDLMQKNIIVDAYIEYKDIKLIVEYNGDQHYRPVCFGGISKQIAQNNFERQQKRDEWLRKYCLANNIVLLEIDGRCFKGPNLMKYIKDRISEILLKLDKGFPLNPLHFHDFGISSENWSLPETHPLADIGINFKDK